MNVDSTETDFNLAIVVDTLTALGARYLNKFVVDVDSSKYVGDNQGNSIG